MPARDGNRSPRDDRSWGSRAKDFVICAEAACIDRLPYCNRGAVEVSWLYCCSYRGPIAQRKGMGIVEVVECVSVNSTLGAMCLNRCAFVWSSWTLLSSVMVVDKSLVCWRFVRLAEGIECSSLFVAAASCGPAGSPRWKHRRGG